MNNKQCPVKYSLHALMHVLANTDESHPLSTQKALAKIEERLRNEGRLTEIDFSKNNSRHIRWKDNLQFGFTYLQKGNYVQREGGQWWITEKGKSWLEKENPDPDAVRQRAREAFKTWKYNQKQKS